MSNIQTEIFFETRAESCELCEGTGRVVCGEHDNLFEKKCLCQINYDEPEYETED